jgi:hypothetical protein
MTVSDRLVAAVPLATVYVWLTVVYWVEAWKRVTPWLFTDELEFTQLSRSIAATGHAARRGEPHSFHSLYIVLTAPLWRIHDVAVAFAAIKYVDVMVMTSVLFPTYFLARMIVTRTPALFAAAGAAAVPSLAYSSWIVEENLAYPYAALCLLLIAKALFVRSRGWIAAAVIASAIAPLVKGELSIVPEVFVLALIFMWWSSDRERARRSTWSRGEWLGVITLVAGAIILFSGFMSHHSTGWLMNTSYNWTKKRIFVFGDWAAGSLAIGIGVVPFVLGLAALVPSRGEERPPGLRVFRSVGTAAVITFGLYAAMKGAYLSQTFANRIVERNLIYICPVLFAGTAYVLSRRVVNLWALGAAAAYALYVVLGVPLFIGNGLYSDALGLAVFEQANRYFLLNVSHARLILVVVLVVGVAAAVAVRFLSRRAAEAVALTLGALVIAWNVTAEVAAAAGNVTISRDMTPTLSHPFTWVDDATHLKPTLYLAQGVADQNPEWLLEFWNRSITTVSSLDATLGGPGPAGAPNITADGQLYWTAEPSDPGKVFDYAVEDWPCVDFKGTLAAVHRYRGGAAQLRTWRLIQLTQPNRLRAFCTGIYPDGWSGANDSTYYRFTKGHPGWLRIRVSRQGYASSPIDVQLGKIATKERFPIPGRVLRHIRFQARTNETVTKWIRTPATPFSAQAVVKNKFSPQQVNPESGDVRTLGAQISYRWFPAKPKG